MQKTTFKIEKMDCPSEEQLIRMQLEGLSGIAALAFDIPSRRLEVVHAGDSDQIVQRIERLHLGASVVSVESDYHSATGEHAGDQQQLLWQVLGINFFFFALELLTGFISNSMGLVADSLDMLADSIVYGLALLVVGGTIVHKKRIAKASGYFQLALAIVGFIEVVRRFTGVGDMPAFQTMILISMLALIGNATCLYLLQKSKSQEAHMQASMIFTSNDVIVNIGVIVAGGLVFFTHSKLPDLIIGAVVFVVVGQGAFKILQLAK